MEVELKRLRRPYLAAAEPDFFGGASRLEACWRPIENIVFSGAAQLWNHDQILGVICQICQLETQ